MTKSIPLIDLLLLLFLTIILINYDHQANLAPEALLMVIQLGLLWGFCRILFFLFPRVPRYVVFAILFVGVVQAMWGLGQLLGYFPSRHRLFNITGSFFNPGPYGGFIALMFPLVLHFWLRFRETSPAFRKYIFLAVGIVCMLVFPATLSRTAWIAAVVGCGLVLVFDTKLVERVKNIYHRYRKTAVVCAVAFCLLCVVAMYGIFHLNTDSANGRLFMWKITVLAIQDAPITGVGLGGFSAAYADAQRAYFGSGQATEIESRVAGSPEFAFNEYLRMFLEQGVLGGVLFLLLTFFIIKKGIRNRQIGVVGSFVALSVFAFASYPYYLWEFTVMWVLLAAMCIAKTDRVSCCRTNPFAWQNWKTTRYNRAVAAYLWAVPCLAILLVASFLVAKQQVPYRQAANEWRLYQSLFIQRNYQAVVDEYARFYPLLNHRQLFLFQYATALNRIGEFEKSNSVARRGLQISTDAVFHNIKGCNYHEMGKFAEAGKQFRSATALIPNRIYPYYRLTLLYSDTNNLHPEKMKRYAQIVLEREPRVFSAIIVEMREIVREILKKWGK